MRVGAYEVVRELGRGGMGVVHEGRAPDGSAVAVKLLTDLEPTAVARFQREASILQLLGRHPNICACRDVGYHAGQPYLVMELHAGGTLHDVIVAGAPRARLARLLLETARALHFAHEAGVVHRDVKPNNILIGAEGQAIVTDFGIARVELDSQRLTRTGALLGTPRYMSPEQAGGERSVDRRADVYALGAMLHEGLTGAPLFEGDGIIILRKVLEVLPPPPAGAPAPLRDLCMAALAKDPDRRPPTAEAFARTLEDWLLAPERTARSAVRALAVGSAAAGALAALLGLGVALGLSRQEARAAGEALAAERAARDARPTDPIAPAAGAAPPAPSGAPSTEPPTEPIDRAGRAALRRAHLAAAAAAGDAREAAAHIERACAVDLAVRAAVDDQEGTVLELADCAGLVKQLVAGATSALAAPRDDEASAAAISRAARWAYLARLLAPRADLGELHRRLRAVRLGPARRRAVVDDAAGPWYLDCFASRAEQEAFLARPDVEGRYDSVDRTTWPASWDPLLFQAERDRTSEGVHAAWLVQRPELSFLWTEASKAAGDAGRFEEAARLADVAWSLERSAETSFWVAKWLLAAGRAEDALPAARRTIAAGGGRIRPWHLALLGEVLVELGELDEVERIIGQMEGKPDDRDCKHIAALLDARVAAARGPTEGQ